jgi:hypothetical protein
MLPIVPTTVIWYVGHGILYWWFSVFISPMKNSDRGNVTYFWAISFSTLLVLISSISHAPRLIHSESSRLIDTVAFTWAVLPLVALALEILSRITRMAFGYALTVPLRVLFSNTLLVTLALGFQYMACLDNGYFSTSYNQTSLFDMALVHCATLESPTAISIPVVLTILIVWVLSEIVRRVTGSTFFQTRHCSGGHSHHWFGESILEEAPVARPVQLPMVPWFSLGLTSTAIQLLVTVKIFVGRLDIRHIMRSLCREETDILFDLRNETWVDFFADGGDGFNSSYTIARQIAQPNLNVVVPKTVRMRLAATSSGQTTPKRGGKESTFFPPSSSSTVIQRRVTSFFGQGAVDIQAACDERQYIPGKNDELLSLPRATVVIHGGDLAYPRPSYETYKTRFVGPIEAAFSSDPGTQKTSVSGRPKMFLIPGNHDWYDSCESFIQWIIGREKLGGWLLPQKNSYFCLQLRSGWWLFALDLALTDDLDVFQLQEFTRILNNHVDANDRVIVVTHRPQWIFDPYQKHFTGELFHQLLDRIGPARLALRLAGDIHNYTRYSGGHGLPSLVVSGGAGAFLHPTHVPEPGIVHEYFHHWEKKRAGEEKFFAGQMQEDNSVEDDSSQLGDNPVEDDDSTDSIPIETQPMKKQPSKPYYHYHQSCAYPSIEISRKLAYLNPFHFRDRNWGADIVFGLVYIGMGVSVVPICAADKVVYASSISEALRALVMDVIVPSIRSVWTDSILSMMAQMAFFGALFAVVGHTRHPVWQRAGIAFGHFCAHAIAAVTIFALIEVGVAYLASHAEGRDSVLRDGLRVPGFIDGLDTMLFGDEKWIEWGLKYFLRFVDLPSSLIRNRGVLCAATVPMRPILFRYFIRVLPVYWLMATPVAALITGTYLLMGLNWFGLHLNEGFSSLRIEDYKNFLRMRICPNTGNLHVYVIGTDIVPKQWEADPAWDPRLFAAANQTIPASHRWVTPSKWRPKGVVNNTEPKLVDYFVVPKKPVMG